MEKGSASIIIERKIFYICRWKCSDSLSHGQIRRLLSCIIFKKVSPPSDLVGSILRFSLIKEFSHFHTCFVRQKSLKTLATIGTLYSTSTMEKRWRWRISVLNASAISKSGQVEYRRRRREEENSVITMNNWMQLEKMMDPLARLQCCYKFCLQFRVFYPLSWFIF